MLKRIFSGTALKIVLTILMAAAMILGAGCSNAVATINEIPVKQDEVDMYINFLLSQDPEAASNLTDEELRELEASLIDSLLVVKLLEQYAENNNIAVSREEIEMQMDSIISSYADESEFEDDLKEKNVDREFLENEIESQILRNKIYTETTAGVIVTEEQVEEYYEENREAMFTIPERVRVSHILSIFPWMEDDSLEESEQGKEDARDKIEFVIDQLEKGAEFGDMAREYSDDAASSSDGGDLGFINRGQMVEEFEEAAFSLNVGEVSGIVETRFGYHIIKVFDRQEESVQSLEEVKESVSTYISDLYKLEKWEEFIMGLINDAEIAYLTEIEGTLKEPAGDTGDAGSSDDGLLDDESLKDYMENNE